MDLGSLEEAKGERVPDKRNRLLRELLLDFTRHSTLHGLRYFTARGLTIFEKFFWVIIFGTSLCFSVWAMSAAWLKWQNGIIITVNEQLMSAFEVPFPAVTICPQTKVNQKYFNFTKHYITYKRNLALLESGDQHNETKRLRLTKFREQTAFLEKLANIACICSITNYDDIRDYANQNTVKDIFEAAPLLHDVIGSGSFRDKYVPPQFTPMLTEEGVCFTFNGLANDDILRTDRKQSNKSHAQESQKGWTLEGGYSTSDFNVYPRRGNKNGLTPDLNVYLRYHMDRVFLCEDMFSNSGFKMYLHHPADVPQTSLRHYGVQADESVSFAIKVNVVTTSDALMKYPPHVRNCYFAWEKSLHYFKVYTPSNCRIECQANITLKRCGCLLFYMPSTENTSLCVGGHATECYNSLSDKAKIIDSQCQCLPSCFSVQYDADVTKTNLDQKSILLGRNDVWNEIENNSILRPRFKMSPRSKSSHIGMYFKDEEFVTMRRSVLYGTMDLLASCGGLLGLFLGFSFMSLLELVFYFTLRLMCICRRR